MVQQWYYAKGEQKIGPITAGELKRLAENAELLPDDLVWREGLRDWMPAKRVRGLFPENETPSGTLPTGPVTSSSAQDTQRLSPLAEGTHFDANDKAGPTQPGLAIPEAVAAELGDDQRPTYIPKPPPLSTTPPRLDEGRRGRLTDAFENSPTTFARSRESLGGRVFDGLLKLARQHFGSEFINATLRLFALGGKIGLWAGAAVIFVSGLTTSIQLRDAQELFPSIVVAAFLVILQYLSSRILFVLERWDRLVHAQLGSSASTDGLSLIAFFIGITGLVALTVIAVRDGPVFFLFIALGVFIVFAYLGLSILNLEGMNISIVPETTPAEEAIGLIQCFLKMMLRMTPVLFGTLILLGFFQVLIGWFFSLNQGASVPYGDLEPFAEAPKAGWLSPALQASGRNFLLLGAFFPVGAYLAFVFGQLALALLASILAIPARLEQLERDRTEVSDA